MKFFRSPWMRKYHCMSSGVGLGAIGRGVGKECRRASAEGESGPE